VAIKPVKSKLAFLAFAALTLAACEGSAGPTGPEGPAGPGTRIVFAGTLDAEGFAGHTLPAEAGDSNELPSATCWLSDDGIIWVQVGCFLGVEFDGSLVVILAGAAEDAGLRYNIVVVY
jgi:hypothetical protein